MKLLKEKLITQRIHYQLDRIKRIWYLSPMRAAKVQASLRIRVVSPEPPLLARTSSESRGTFRQKARSLVLLNGRAWAVKICHDGMLEDTNSLDGAQLFISLCKNTKWQNLSFCPKKSFSASNFFMHIFNMSVTCLENVGKIQWNLL